MMIRKISIFSALSALALMAACTSTDDWQGEGDRVPITLTTAIAPTRTMALTQDEQLLNGETVYIWANQEATAGTTVWADNAYLKAWTLTANGTGALTPANDKYYPEKSMSMLALHGNLTYTEGTSAVPTGTLNHSVLTDQSTQANYAKSDLLIWAGSNITKQATLPLQMHHKLSKIEIQLTSTDFTAAELNSAVVTITSIKPTATVTIDNSVATTQGTMGSATGSATTITPYRADANQPEYEAIIPCGQAKPATLIHVKMSDETLSFDVNPDAPADAANFLENKRYHYTLTINRKAVAVTTSITDWDVIPTTASTTVAPFTMRLNPLWYVAQYNMAQNKTSFVSEHSTASQYVFTFNDALAANIAGYHVPTREEQVSIIPSDATTATGSSVTELPSTSLADPYELSEIACNIGGIDVPASTSIFGKYATKDYYAIRFINTSYVSAWHYKWVTSPCNGYLIESYMLQDINTLDQAKAKMAEAGFATTIFTGAYGASLANQKPEDKATIQNGFAQRFLPVCGNRSNSSSGTASANDGTTGYYWSSSPYGPGGFYWYASEGGHLDEGLQTNDRNTYAYSVRLFRSTEASARKTTIAIATTSELAVGDIVCADGSIYAAANASAIASEGRTPIGIIAFVNSKNHDISIFNNAGDAATESGRGRYAIKSTGRALVICLKHSDTGIKWRTENTPYSTVYTFIDNTDRSLDTNIEFYRGYDRTEDMATNYAAGTFPAAESAYNYATLAAPQFTTGWFLPSAGQWRLIVAGLTDYKYLNQSTQWSYTYDAAYTGDYLANLVDTKLSAAGTYDATYVNPASDGYYATSSEYGPSHAAILNWHTAGIILNGNNRAETNFYVRPVLAF